MCSTTLIKIDFKNHIRLQDYKTTTLQILWWKSNDPRLLPTLVQT